VTISLSVSIMHCNDVAGRRACVAEQMRQLQHDPRLAFVEVVKDPVREGVWATSRRAWKRAGVRGATHHLVIQDDAVLCEGFVGLMLGALEAVPAAPVGPYCPRKIATEAQARGESWCWAPDGVWGVAFCLPTPMVYDFLRWYGPNWAPGSNAEDGALTAWVHATGVGVWLTVPSLVDHMPGPSLLGHSLERHAAVWEPSPTAPNWSHGLADPVRGTANRPFWRHPDYRGPRP